MSDSSPTNLQPSPKPRNHSIEEEASQSVKDRLGPEDPPSFWFEVTCGIGVGEFFFPFCFYSLIYTLSWLTDRFSIHESLLFVLFLLLYLLMIGGGIMLLVSALVSSLVASVVTLWHVSFRINHENKHAAALTGAGVGLVTTSPFTISSGYLNGETLLALVLASVFGQLGGTWRARKVLRDIQSRSSQTPTSTETFQFGIRHLLILTAWCAALLTILKILDLFSILFLWVFIIWLVTHVITLGAEEITLRTWERFRLRNRST